MGAKSEEDIRRLADKWDEAPSEVRLKDPEFLDMTAEDVEALAAEYGRRAGRVWRRVGEEDR